MKEVFNKIKNIKSKKTVVALLILSLAFVSGTLAYYQNTFAVNNPFETSQFLASVDEAFVSPEGWMPGDTTAKTLTVTNDGDVSLKVRVSIVETWKDRNNNTISGTLPNGEKAAIINYNNNTDKWLAQTCGGNTYFVYTDTLDSNDTTDSLINSVTFNPNATGTFSCSTVTNQSGGSTVQCDANAADYDGARYTLSFNVETVQSTAASTSWGTCTTNTYTVTFNGNGNDSGSTAVKTCTYGENCTLTANGFVKDGYTFQGWATSTNGEAIYDDEEVVKNLAISGNVNLYAKWFVPKCVRAETLHTTTCINSKNGCNDTVGNGNEIIYGRLGSGDSLVAGDAFDCDVNGDGTYDAATERFYYVSDYYNTSTKLFESDTAVLIYYNNVAAGVPNNSALFAYYSPAQENWHGPVTALAQLPTTTQWSNVSLKNTSRQILTDDLSIANGMATSNDWGETYTNTLPIFSYAGYAARLLTTQELESACGITVGSYTDGELDTCAYLMENTKYESLSIYSSGYWFESPEASSPSTVWFVDWSYRIMNVFFVDSDSTRGARPVIEILKSDISK